MCHFVAHYDTTGRPATFMSEASPPLETKDKGTDTESGKGYLLIRFLSHENEQIGYGKSVNMRPIAALCCLLASLSFHAGSAAELMPHTGIPDEAPPPDLLDLGGKPHSLTPIRVRWCW